MCGAQSSLQVQQKIERDTVCVYASVLKSISIKINYAKQDRQDSYLDRKVMLSDSDSDNMKLGVL